MLIQKISLILFILILIPACASNPGLEFHSLVHQQPMVLKVEPPSETLLENPLSFVLHFSERVDIAKINQDSIALTGRGWVEDFSTDTKELMEALEDGDLETIPLLFELQGDERTLFLTPQSPLENGIYHLTVTPLLTSITGIPFNQRPGATPQAFVATYGLGVTEESLGGPGKEGTAPPSFGPIPEFLVLNEVLYDGKNSETDGEAFVELLGTPEADISDYQIVLINGANGEATDRITLPQGSLLNLEGLFVVADLRTHSDQTTQVLVFHYLDQFDPQNGPDAIHLLDREENLLDALWYGEGGVAMTPEGLPLGEGDPAIDVGAGHSLSRQGGQDTDNNEIDFEDREVPTPGEI